MAKRILATEFLAKPPAPPPVCVVFGDDDFLRRQVLLALRGAVLAGDDDEMSLTRFEGPEAILADVLSELETVAMFGSGRRLVVVEQAAEFVTLNRPALEHYAAHPVETGVLVLEVKSFPSNTRLYKLVANTGLIVDAGTPKDAQLVRWLVDWAAQHHAATMTRPAAQMLIDLTGPELGLLDQEVAKLALSMGAAGRITPELVKQHVGTWRKKTAWEMLDAALDGNATEAMQQLDLLLGSGEQPVGILGQIGYSLRQLAAATRLILQAEASGGRLAPAQALQQAGIRGFVVPKIEPRLRHVGRDRARRLYRWLLEADLDLKGNSDAPDRFLLERLILRLSVPAASLNRPNNPTRRA